MRRKCNDVLPAQQLWLKGAKTKLLIYQVVSVQTLICEHEVWVRVSE